MSETADFDPGPWRGHDFSSARDHYDSHVGRSYSEATSRETSKRDVLEPSLTTHCTNPLLIFCDVTGSMGDWPATMFSKLPYLEHEAKEYLGSDLEIAFGGIGDAQADGRGDRYPLQVRPFTSGTDLKTRMLELVIEQGGGTGLEESYELAALYALHNVSMPRAIKPILIMIGDEKPYGSVSPAMAKVANVELSRQISTAKLFKQLSEKFSVYLVRKPYGRSSGNTPSAVDLEIRQHWVELLGAGHVCDLPVPERVVDVIFGILAHETGRFDDFCVEIEGRQRKEQVATVYKSLASIHKLPAKTAKAVSGKSILKLEDKSGKTRRLLDEGDA